MAAIKIKDLLTGRTLDGKAMSSVRGALGWVNGAFNLPASPISPSFAPVLYQQIVNSYYVEEMINNFQIVDINNSGANSNITAVIISSLSKQ
jgi:hypothetical protein